MKVVSSSILAGLIALLVALQNAPDARAEGLIPPQESFSTELKVLVKTDGTAGDFSITRSCGKKDCDLAALAVVKQWKFSPVTRDGMVVEAWVPVTIKLSVLEQKNGLP